MAIRHAFFYLLVCRYIDLTFTSKDTCVHGGILENVEIEGGFRTHPHALIKGVKNMQQCIRKCCKRMDCDLAMFTRKKCYSVSCKGNDSCKISHLKRESKQTGEIAFILSDKKPPKSAKKKSYKKEKSIFKEDEYETDRDEEESRDLDNEDIQPEFADLDVEAKNTFTQNKTTVDMEHSNTYKNYADNMLNQNTDVLENSTTATPSTGLHQTYLPSRAVVGNYNQQLNNNNNTTWQNPNFASYYNTYYNNYYKNLQNVQNQSINNNSNFYNITGGISTAYQYAVNNTTPTGSSNKQVKYKSTAKVVPTNDAFVTEITGEIEESSGEDEGIGQSAGVEVSENGAVTAKESPSINRPSTNNSTWYQTTQYHYDNGTHQNYSRYSQYNGNGYPTQNHYVTQIKGELGTSELDGSESGDEESGVDEEEPTEKPTRNFFVDEIKEEFKDSSSNKMQRRRKHQNKVHIKKQIIHEENANKKSDKGKKQKSKKKKKVVRNERLLYASTKPTTSPVTQIKKEFENMDTAITSGVNNSTNMEQENINTTANENLANFENNVKIFVNSPANETFKSSSEQNANVSIQENNGSHNLGNNQLLTAANINKPIPVPLFYNITSGAQYIPFMPQQQQQNQQLQQQNQQQQQQNQQLQQQNQSQQQVQQQQQQLQDDKKIEEKQNDYKNLNQHQQLEQQAIESNKTEEISNFTQEQNTQSELLSPPVENQTSNNTFLNIDGQVLNLDFQIGSFEASKKHHKRKKKKHDHKKHLKNGFMNSSDSSRFFDQENSDSIQEGEFKNLDNNTSQQADNSTGRDANNTTQQAPSQISAPVMTTPTPYVIATPAPNPVPVFPTVYMIPLDPNWASVYENQSRTYYQMLDQKSSQAEPMGNSSMQNNISSNDTAQLSANNFDNLPGTEKIQNETSSGIVDEDSASGSGEALSGIGPEQLSDRTHLRYYGTPYKKLSEKSFLKSMEHNQDFIPVKTKSIKVVHSHIRHIKPIRTHETLINTGIKANTLLGKMLTHNTDDNDISLRPIGMQIATPVVAPMMVLPGPQNLIQPETKLYTQQETMRVAFPTPIQQSIPAGETAKNGVFGAPENNDEITNRVLNSLDAKQEILNALSGGPMIRQPTGETTNNNANRDTSNQLVGINNGQNNLQFPFQMQQFNKGQAGTSANNQAQDIPSIDEETLSKLGINKPVYMTSQLITGQRNINVGNTGQMQGRPQLFATFPFRSSPSNEKKSDIEGNALASSIILSQTHEVGKKEKIEKPKLSKRKLSTEKSLSRARYLTKFHPAAAHGMRRNDSTDSHEHSKALLESLILNTHDPARVDITPDPLEEQDANNMQRDTGRFVAIKKPYNKIQSNDNYLDEGKAYGKTYAHSLLLKRNISRSHNNFSFDETVNKEALRNTSVVNSNNTEKKVSKLDEKPIITLQARNETKTNASGVNVKPVNKKEVLNNKFNNKSEKYIRLHLPTSNSNIKSINKDFKKHRNAVQDILQNHKNQSMIAINKTKQIHNESINVVKPTSPIFDAFKNMLIKELHSDNLKNGNNDVSHHKLSKNFLTRIEEHATHSSVKKIQRGFTRHTKYHNIKEFKKNIKYKKSKNKKLRIRRRKNKKRKRKVNHSRRVVAHKKVSSVHSKVNSMHSKVNSVHSKVNSVHSKYIVHKAYEAAKPQANQQDIMHGHPMDGHRFGDSEYQSSHKWANHDFSPQPGHYGMHDDTSDNHDNADKFADIYNNQTTENGTENNPNKTVVEEEKQDFQVQHSDGSLETGTQSTHREATHFESNSYKPLHASKPVIFGMGNPSLNHILNNLPSMMSHPYVPPYYPIYFGLKSRKIGRHEGLPLEHGKGLLLQGESRIGNRGMFSNMHVKERNIIKGAPIRYLTHDALQNSSNNLNHLESKTSPLTNHLHEKSHTISKQPIGFLEAFKQRKQMNVKREKAINDRLGVFNRLANTLRSNLEAFHKARKQRPPLQAWNTFVSSQKRIGQLTEARKKVIENHGNQGCERGLTVRGATLRGGILSGEFQSMGVVSTQKVCTALCCSRKRCDIAMTIGRECINIKCFNKKACTIAPAGHLAVYRNILPVVTFVKRVPTQNSEIFTDKTHAGLKRGNRKRSTVFSDLETEEQLENANPKDIAAVKALVTDPKFVS